LSRHPIESVRPHVDDRNPNGERTFSRDCPEYDVILPDGTRLIVLPNHFKSKRNGDDDTSKKRRTAQANRAHDIATAALTRSPYVLIAGDLNDTPDSTTLPSLFSTGFHDVQDHADYPTDRPGTYGTGLKSGKFDYLIASPSLWNTVQGCGIERSGSYHPNLWPSFDTVTKTSEEASDHHCVWMDVNL
jgi:predicted extracellular nuclease